MDKKIKLALPKGRLYEEVKQILDEAGFGIKNNGRNYRPKNKDPEIEVKLLKPQNIPKLVEIGSRDLAFTGYDWILEKNANVETLMDLELNKVKLVAAISKEKNYEDLKRTKIKVASEYKNISIEFLKKQNCDVKFIQSYGATEVFIPEDADMIIENTETGRTLIENNLKIVDNVISSSTLLIANKESMKNKWKKSKIEAIMMMLKSVLEARKRVFVEMNISKENLEKIVDKLPCMKRPTISKLYGEKGYAVKIAFKKDELKDIIPFLKKNKASDIIIIKPSNIVV